MKSLMIWCANRARKFHRRVHGFNSSPDAFTAGSTADLALKEFKKANRK